MVPTPPVRRPPRRNQPRQCRHYLTSTVAPCFFQHLLDLGGFVLDTPSLTVFGAPSTRSLASFRPEAGDGADFLDHVDLLVAAAVRMTVNSVCSSTGRRRRRRATGRRPRPARRRRRPTSLRAAWTARRLRERSGGQLVNQFARSAICKSSWDRMGCCKPRWRYRRSGGFRLVLLGIGREDPCELAGRCLKHAGDLASRGLQHPQQLAAQLVERRQVGERLDPAAFSVWAPRAPPMTTNFSLVLANSTATFATATGSFAQASAVGPFSSGERCRRTWSHPGRDGQPVLRDFEARPGARIFSRRSVTSATVSPVVGDDDHRRSAKTSCERSRRTRASPYGPCSSPTCAPVRSAEAGPGCTTVPGRTRNGYPASPSHAARPVDL
jgi:hypothetical protein